MDKHHKGCYQWTYCDECMIFPMDFNCPKAKTRHETDQEVEDL